MKVRSLERIRDQIAGTTRLRLILQNAAGRTSLTPGLIDHLLQAIDSEHEAQLITIEGVPGSFCEGLELELLARDEAPAARLQLSQRGLARFETLLRAIEQTPRPVVALVDGVALGGGVGLAAAADLVLASPRASFALPETLMGLIPAMVFPVIARRIGAARARLLALGGKPLSASVALQCGLVDEIADDLEVALARYSRRFSRMDPRAVGVMKHLVATHFTTPSAYTDEAAAHFSELLESHETRRRLVRFAAGETPWPE